MNVKFISGTRSEENIKFDTSSLETQTTPFPKKKRKTFSPCTHGKTDIKDHLNSDSPLSLFLDVRLEPDRRVEVTITW